jgi:hypothetical protein
MAERPNARYWHVSLWLEPSWRPHVQDLARAEGLTVNGLVKHLLARALREHDPAWRPPPREEG